MGFLDKLLGRSKEVADKTGDTAQEYGGKAVDAADDVGDKAKDAFGDAKDRVSGTDDGPEGTPAEPPPAVGDQPPRDEGRTP